MGDDNITLGKVEFRHTKAQLEQQVRRQAKMTQEEQREHKAYTAAASDGGGQG